MTRVKMSMTSTVNLISSRVVCFRCCLGRGVCVYESFMVVVEIEAQFESGDEVVALDWFG